MAVPVYCHTVSNQVPVFNVGVAEESDKPVSVGSVCRWFRLLQLLTLTGEPCAGSGVVRIDPLHFLAGCCKRQLNQALPVLSLSLGFLSMSVVLLTRVTLRCVILCYLCVLSLGCSC